MTAFLRFHSRSYVYRIRECGTDAELMEAEFLSPTFDYPEALRVMTDRCTGWKAADATGRYRRNIDSVLGVISDSMRRVKRNCSPTIIVPEGGLLALMTLSEYAVFSKRMVDAAAKSPWSVEGGLCSITFNTVQLTDGDDFIIVMANLPLTADTVLVSKFEIVESMTRRLQGPLLSSVFVAEPQEAGFGTGWVGRRRSLVDAGLSTNPMIRFELFAKESVQAGEALCGEALIPFGRRPDLDRAWESSSVYYRLVHEGVEFRPSLFNPVTGEVHSCLWMANDALAPCSEYPYAAGVNCDLRVMDDVGDFLGLFPPVDPGELNDYPEVRDLVRGEEGSDGSDGSGWIYYVLCSTQNISKGSPLRFSYGLYSDMDNQRSEYRAMGVRGECSEQQQWMFFDTLRPLPKICKVYPCTKLISGQGEGEFPVMYSNRWRVQQPLACLFRGGRSGALGVVWGG